MRFTGFFDKIAFFLLASQTGRKEVCKHKIAPIVVNLKLEKDRCDVLIHREGTTQWKFSL